MEEIVDFDTWLKNYVPPEVKYYAIYNPDTGEVTGIYPDSAAGSIEHKIPIDLDLAEDIQNGIVRMNTCFVDASSEKIEIVEKHSLRKIDDVLHRIIDKEYSKVTEPDIVVKYNTTFKRIVIEMSETLKNKKLKFDGETITQFLVTSYNDPHQVYETISFKLGDLKKNPQSIPFNFTGKRFSVFTRRLFKNYVFEIV